MRIRRRQRRFQSAASVSLTPLIDTALTLLVVFMVTAPVAHHSIRVNLPQSSMEDAVEPQVRELIVSIDKQGALFLDGVATKQADLLKAVQQLDKTVPVLIFLRIDRDATYGSAIELLAKLRQIEGIQSVAFDIDFEQQTV